MVGWRGYGRRGNSPRLRPTNALLTKGFVKLVFVYRDGRHVV